MVRKPNLPDIKAHLDFINSSFKGDTLKLILYVYAETYLKGRKKTVSLKREDVALAIGRSTDSIKKRSVDLAKSNQLKILKSKTSGHSYVYELNIPELKLSEYKASSKAGDRAQLVTDNRKKSKIKRFQNIKLKRG